MKLPSFRRISKTDYPADIQDLVEKLGVSINNGFEVLFEALNKKVDFTNNIDSTVKDITVTVDATGKPTTPTSFAIHKPTPIQGLFVIKAENTANSSVYPSGAVFLSWTQTAASVKIDNVAGLVAGNAFSLRVVVLG